jgi:ABC-2 type transport system ATP-binding protein
VGEILRFFSLCYDGERPLHELLESFGLRHKQHVQARALSVGEQQRVSLALVFVKAFAVLLLDEPTAGLDADGRQRLWDEVRRARARGAAVLYATHLLDEAQQLSDRLLVLQAGCQVALDSPQNLLARVEGREKVEIRGASGIRQATLARLPGITAVLCRGETVTLYCHSARDVLSVLLAQDSTPNISCGVLTLEDVFRLLTTRNAKENL